MERRPAAPARISGRLDGRRDLGTLSRRRTPGTSSAAVDSSHTSTAGLSASARDADALALSGRHVADVVALVDDVAAAGLQHAGHHAAVTGTDNATLYAYTANARGANSLHSVDASVGNDIWVTN